MTNLISNKTPYVFAAVFAMALYSSSVLADTLPAVQQSGDVTYITGGIGDEERDALKAVKQDYNLRILSAGVQGAYVGDAHIIISDNKGQELLNTNGGPIFYAKLPNGHYAVSEERHEETKKQSIVISASKPTDITFRWK